MFRSLRKLKTKQIVIPVLVIVFLMTLFVSGPLFATYGVGDEWDMDVRYADFSYTDVDGTYSASGATLSFIDFISRIDDSMLVFGAESNIYDFDIDGNELWDADTILAAASNFHYPDVYLEFGNFDTYDIAGEAQVVQEPVESYTEFGYFVSVYKIRFMVRISVMPEINDCQGLMTFTDSEGDSNAGLTSFPECKESTYSTTLALSMGNRTDIDIGDSVSFIRADAIAMQYFQTIGGVRYDIEEGLGGPFAQTTDEGTLDSGFNILGGHSANVDDVGNATVELSAFLQPGFKYSGDNYILYGVGIESVFEVLVEIKENQYSNSLIQLPDFLLGRLPAIQTFGEIQANAWIYLTLLSTAIVIMVAAMKTDKLSDRRIVAVLVVLPFIIGGLLLWLQIMWINPHFGIG